MPKTQNTTNEPATLKDKIFSAARIRHVSAETKAICPTFDTRRFLALTLYGLDDRSLMERLRCVTEALHVGLAQNFRPALKILRKLAPRLDNSFVTMVLSDYVALYGAEDFDVSMDALRFFTPFGSSEFAVRHFMRRDLQRTLAVMETWAKDKDEHVRRLASEGCRPRLPWSFQIEPLIADPAPVAAILESLKADPSLYVRKSVANHLNDITKDHPGWVLDRIRGWSRDDPRTVWIVRHALRTLIKKGDRNALTIIGAGEDAQVRLRKVVVEPKTIRLGEAITLSFDLTSTSDRPQKLVVDYAIHYVRAEARKSRKVFKLKTLTLAPGESVTLQRRQSIRDFSVRAHHPGRHLVDVMVNGQTLSQTSFDLLK
ncbi:DNA alkylation repair protein [Bradyrhizobium prioriisuperbiae]|uniref:DNA alkylation repair protein n=1 Tax=Bradyrhizobium prioriisuperbiae TaxID=2854389 RepID=UPI0028EDED5B|nr:DNA alkylation repair protein [Bradyrhizobium prioritasuperba]